MCLLCENFVNLPREIIKIFLTYLKYPSRKVKKKNMKLFNCTVVVFRVVLLDFDLISFKWRCWCGLERIIRISVPSCSSVMMKATISEITLEMAKSLSSKPLAVLVNIKFPCFSLIVLVLIFKGEQNDVNIVELCYITTCILKTTSFISYHSSLIYQIEGSEPKPHQIF